VEDGTICYSGPVAAAEGPECVKMFSTGNSEQLLGLRKSAART